MTYRQFKRIFDVMVICILSPLILPIFFMVIVLILLFDGRPVFFLQERLGQGGKPFKIIKFRTMIPGAEKKGSGIFTEENDPRITKIGKFLRKTSLDELPQLINVLKGDMSLVGPRPPLTNFPYAYEQYPDHVKKRFLVKPGLTGLAQVRFRNSAGWDKKFESDVEYVENMNFLLDLNVIFLTFWKVLKGDAVYGKGSRGE